MKQHQDTYMQTISLIKECIVSSCRVDVSGGVIENRKKQRALLWVVLGSTELAQMHHQCFGKPRCCTEQFTGANTKCIRKHPPLRISIIS